MKNASVLLCLVALGAPSTGCIADATTNPLELGTEGTRVTYALAQPVLTGLTPNEVTLGDEAQVLGEAFIDDAHGRLWLAISGAFTDGSRWKGMVPLTYVRSSLAHFIVGPSSGFPPADHAFSEFTGLFQVVNELGVRATNAQAGDRGVSDAIQTELRVLRPQFPGP